MAIEAKVTRRIEDIPREDWNKVYPDILEGYNFFRALDESRFEEFPFYYILVYDDGLPIAATSCFLLDYSLDTSIKGPLRRFSNFIRDRKSVV